MSDDETPPFGIGAANAEEFRRIRARQRAAPEATIRDAASQPLPLKRSDEEALRDALGPTVECPTILPTRTTP